MRIEKHEISKKIGKLKGLLSNNPDTVSGCLLYTNNCLIADNSEICVKAQLQGTGETFAIPKSAVEMIEKLPSGTIEIIADDKSITIKSGRINNRYNAISPDAFCGAWTTDKMNNSQVLNGQELQDAISSVLHAVSDNDMKPVLTGAYFDASDGVLNIVGCDGYRLAWNRVKCDGEFELIVPKKTLQRFLAMGITGDITLLWDSKSLVFKNEEYEIHSRTISGQYMDYKKIVKDNQKNAAHKITIDRGELIEGLGRSLICAEKNSTPSVLNFKNDTLTLSLRQNVSEYEEWIEVDSSAECDITIGFNGRYLFEILKAFPSDTVTLLFNSSITPMIIIDGDLKAFVLPVRLG